LPLLAFLEKLKLIYGNLLYEESKINTKCFVHKAFLFDVHSYVCKADEVKPETNAFIAADNIEYGYKNKIPLWLFGFLY
jgi:hypothetical protein